ncbi:hypothetical protein ABPG74_003630 [Tetrahymena malaccensis]
MKKDNQQISNNKLKKWECRGCLKKYSSQSSLYNHIDIKHPKDKDNKKDLIKNEFLNKIGRPKKEKNTPEITEKEDDFKMENSSSELILGFYKNKLWVQFLLQFKDYIGGGSAFCIDTGMNSEYEDIKNYFDKLETQYNDLSYLQTQKEKEDFIKQVFLFSQNIKNEIDGLRFNISKAIILFYLMNTSMDSNYEKQFFHELQNQNIDQEILNKVCKVFCCVNDSNYGYCKYQGFVQEPFQQFF